MKLFLTSSLHGPWATCSQRELWMWLDTKFKNNTWTYKTFVFFGNFIVQFLTMNFIDDNFMLQCQKVGHTCDVRVGSYSSTGVNHMQIITLEFHSKYLCGHRQCTYCYYFPQWIFTLYFFQYNHRRIPIHVNSFKTFP